MTTTATTSLKREHGQMAVELGRGLGHLVNTKVIDMPEATWMADEAAKKCGLTPNELRAFHDLFWDSIIETV